MPDRSVDFLLIGGGVAAARCARTLREEGAEGEIMLVGREPEAPYDRPPLSKGYLRGESGREDALAESPDWWEHNGVELLTRTSVMKLDPEGRTAKLSTKEEVGFGKALLATGANVRRLRADGADLEGIHYLRAFGNSDAIREEAAEAERVVLIGGSYIGCEVAASLAAGLGKQCTIVMQEDEVLERTVGPSLAPFFGDILREHGVEIHGGDSLDRFEGSEGRVSRVVTEGGLELDGEMVIVGAGVMPDVMLARSGGLELGEAGGVLCSAGLETSLEGVFAAGDMCEYHSVIHGRPMRLEHWDVAGEHGKTAARNMLGRGVDHEVVPYFFSDLADWVSLGYVGPGSGEPAIRGSVDDGSFTAFYLDDARVTAALTVGRDDDLDHARRFITDGASRRIEQLSDEGFDLAGL
ncbi:MAG: FAD-dependent oxidoreductase [Actinomycetota bacterium]|nr:FAD-dependent oxidoreductase [Actinomycetota bacterium]